MRKMIKWLKAKLKRIIFILLGIGVVSAAGVALQPEAILSVQVNNELIEFHYTDDNFNENLIIHTNSEEYTSGDDIHISVENKSGEPQIASLSMFIEEGEITELQKLHKNAPYEVMIDDYEMEQYDCSYVATSTQETIEQTCERRKSTGSHKETEYKDIWKNVELEEFVKLDYYQFIAVNEVPEKNKKGFQATKKSEVVILEGETVYLKAKIKAPLWGNKSNEFFVEIIGDSSYGSLDPYISGYTTRRKLTIDNTKIDDDLVNFPVTVTFTSSTLDFTKANADGFDLRFTEADGDTLIKYERERHDNGSSLGEYHVKVPAVASSTDTDFYVYYKVADTGDGADATNVWDSNFKGVWHMKDITTSTINDSTSNANNGTKGAANNPVEATGKIAKGQDFESGSSNYITMARSATLEPTRITVEVWTKPESQAQFNCMVANYESGSPYRGYSFMADATNMFVQMYAGGARVNNWTSDAHGMSNGTFYHWVLVYDGDNQILYKNGEPFDSNDVADGDITFDGATLTNFGRHYDGHYYDGVEDEIRISGVARTASWIKATYNSTNNSLLTYGDEEEDTGTRRILKTY